MSQGHVEAMPMSPTLTLLLLRADKMCACGTEAERIILGALLLFWGGSFSALAGVMSLGCAMSPGPPHL